MKEQTLSDKEIEGRSLFGSLFYGKDVKEKIQEFNKKLKEQVERIQMDCATLDMCNKDEVNEIIDELALEVFGDKLI